MKEVVYDVVHQVAHINFEQRDHHHHSHSASNHQTHTHKEIAAHTHKTLNVLKTIFENNENSESSKEEFSFFSLDKHLVNKLSILPLSHYEYASSGSWFYVIKPYQSYQNRQEIPPRV